MRVRTGPGELLRFSRSRDQMSRSHKDDHGNLLNSIARETLNRFEPKLHKYLLHFGDKLDSFSRKSAAARAIYR